MIRPTPHSGAERNIDMLLGNRDRMRSTPQRISVTTSDGQTISYGQMIWATGGSPQMAYNVTVPIWLAFTMCAIGVISTAYWLIG